jgi:hypothetical protein
MRQPDISTEKLTVWVKEHAGDTEYKAATLRMARRETLAFIALAKEAGRWTEPTPPVTS